ncbi:MAG TPA: MASE1 domain-containing protein [Candidatus Angelobacter sp.]
MDGVSVFERFAEAAGLAQRDRKGLASKFVVVAWLPGATSLLVAAGYYAGTKIGFAFTTHQTPIALFWPPNAILLAAFLLSPTRVWTLYLLAVLPAHLLAQAQAGIPLSTSLGWYTGNTSEALIGAVAVLYLSKVSKTDFTFGTTRGLKVFLLGAVFVAPLFTSFIDAAGVVWSGYARGYWTLWGTRLVSNMISNLTLVPLIVTLCRDGFAWFSRSTIARVLELVVLLVGTAMVSAYVFAPPSKAPNDITAAIFAPLPFLLWAALRFGIGGASFSLLTVAWIALSNAARGLQTAGTAVVARNVLTIQVLIGAFGILLMWIAALVSEQKRIRFPTASRRAFLMKVEHALRDVGRKLHADLTQQLTLLGLDIENLGRGVESSSPMKQRLLAVNEQIAELSAEVRDWSHDLDPVSIEYLGLEEALNSLCRQASEKSGVKFDFSAEIEGERVDYVTSLNLYRILQEVANHIVKLSSAHSAKVNLKVKDKSAWLTIEDDTTDMRSETQESNIINTRDRVAVLNGTFSIASSHSGTWIEVSLPLP